MSLLRCRTDHALLLVAVPDSAGVLRFPSDLSQPTLYGLHLAIEPLLPVSPQLMDAACQALNRDVSLGFDLCQEFADEVQVTSEKVLTVFVGRITHPEVKAPETWLSLPEILRSMARDRRRLPYLRALQVLTGALSQETKAVDVEDIARHLQGGKAEGPDSV